jgi:hypothetical protein
VVCQVYNTRDSIKFAVDFISPLSIETMLDMASKLSKTNSAQGKIRTDLVGFRSLFYHVWMRYSKMNKVGAWMT